MKLVKPSDCVHRYLTGYALRVRMFRPTGQYPRAVITANGCLYYASDDVVFTVVKSQPYSQEDPAFPYSEMIWATPQELRFWASIILCEDAEGPKALFYPEYDVAGLLEPADLDFSNPAVQEQLKSLVIKELLIEKGSSQQRSSLFDHEINLDRQPMFFRAIAADDHVLLRGISCLIKCDMLSRHREFIEEATVIVFIALDASFALVCNLLCKSGVLNPTAVDAGKWLDETFNKPIGIMGDSGKYFEAFYEQRVITMHPYSRFGNCPFAPLLVDDLFQLRRELREIFAYLASGQHGPEFDRRKAAVVLL